MLYQGVHQHLNCTGLDCLRLPVNNDFLVELRTFEELHYFFLKVVVWLLKLTDDFLLDDLLRDGLHVVDFVYRSEDEIVQYFNRVEVLQGGELIDVLLHTFEENLFFRTVVELAILLVNPENFNVAVQANPRQ